MIATGMLVLSLLGQGGQGGIAPTETLLVAESPRSGAIEFRLGGFRPLLGAAYDTTFGGRAMLLAELEYERQLWQELGSLAVGMSAGYAEKYGAALLADGTRAAESTSLKVVPLKALAVYRFDYLPREFRVPLVPYVKAGLAFTPWWTTKGANVEVFGGRRGEGANWGYAGVLGLALELDFLDPRLARDFDSDMGVNHSYFFAEYVYQNVDSFGSNAFDLSSRHWMFGLTLEY